MCGNVTLLGRRLRGEKSAFPKRAQTLLRDMLRVSQMRGAQSGGGAVQVRRSSPRPGTEEMHKPQAGRSRRATLRGPQASGRPLAGTCSQLRRSNARSLCHGWTLVGPQVFVHRVARGVSKFRLCSYDRSRTKDQVFAPTTAAPVSAAALYQLLAQSRERLRVSQHLGLSTAGAYSEPRPHVPRVRTLIWGTEERRPPSAVA